MNSASSIRTRSSVRTRSSAKSEAVAVKAEGSSTETASSRSKPSAASSPSGSVQGFPVGDTPKPAKAGGGQGAAAGASSPPPAIVQNQEDSKQHQQQQPPPPPPQQQQQQQQQEEHEEHEEQADNGPKDEGKRTGDGEKQDKGQGQETREKEEEELEGDGKGAEETGKKENEGKDGGAGDSAAAVISRGEQRVPSVQPSAPAETPDLDGALRSPRSPAAAVPSNPARSVRGVAAPARGFVADQHGIEEAANDEEEQASGDELVEWGGVSEGMFRKRIAEDLKTMLRRCGGRCQMQEVAAKHRATFRVVMNLQGHKVNLAFGSVLFTFFMQRSSRYSSFTDIDEQRWLSKTTSFSTVENCDVHARSSRKHLSRPSYFTCLVELYVFTFHPLLIRNVATPNYQRQAARIPPPTWFS